MNSRIAKNDCFFNHNGICDITGTQCTSCRFGFSQIEGIDYRDHYFIYEKRREARHETKYKYIAILISVIALLVSFWSAYQGHKTGKTNNEYFYIDTQFIEALRQSGLPESTLAKISGICGIRFRSVSQLSNRLLTVLNREEKRKFGMDVLKYIRQAHEWRGRP